MSHHPDRPNSYTEVRRLLDGWTPPCPDPVEEAETVAWFRSEFGYDEDDMNVDTLRRWRADYGPTDDDEARDQLADAIVRHLDEIASLPGPRNWQRWKATGRLARFLYASGITYSGGAVEWNGIDPWGRRYHLPHLSHLRRAKHGRPYILWMSQEVRSCLRTQASLAAHGHQPPGGWHRPGSADVYGICGRCFPWACCGSTTGDHRDGCPELGVTA